MKECIIMPDRGDRKPLTDFQRKRFKNYDIISADWEPVSTDYDIVPRFKWMVTEAINQGYEWIWVIENDDYYPRQYLDRMRKMAEGYNWIGSNRAYYYHIPSKTYEEKFWRKNAGLWNMGFSADFLKEWGWDGDKFEESKEGFTIWPPDYEAFLDSRICSFTYYRDDCTWVNQSHGGIGIKAHGFGIHGSLNHHRQGNSFAKKDPNCDWLRSHTDAEYMEFIEDLGLL